MIAGASLVASGKESTCQCRRCGFYPWVRKILSLGQEDPLEKGMATHSSILAWRIPWTEEPQGCKESDMTEWLSMGNIIALHVKYACILFHSSFFSWGHHTLSQAKGFGGGWFLCAAWSIQQLFSEHSLLASSILPLARHAKSWTYSIRNCCGLSSVWLMLIKIWEPLEVSCLPWSL